MPLISPGPLIGEMSKDNIQNNIQSESQKDRPGEDKIFPTKATFKRKPAWLRVNLNPEKTREVVELMDRLNLHTVCREARCPNMGECYERHTATFMILGAHCTRNCRFCDVSHGKPEAVDEKEPQHLAEAAKALGLWHVVVTSVDRDDLPDGGAAQFARVIRALHSTLPEASVEVLIPDFRGSEEALMTVLEAGPQVLNHNVETVKELYSRVQPSANYEVTLQLLRRAHDYAEAQKAAHPETERMVIKTGMMLGLGETDEEIKVLFQDLVAAGTDVLTLGQYLRPSEEQLPVERYVSPEDFARYREMALEAGFAYVAASPLVRSSYHAEEALEAVRAREGKKGPEA